MSRTRSTVCIAALAIFLFAATRSGAQSVAPASYSQPSQPTAGNAQTVRFARRAPQMGDQLEQHVLVDLQLNTMVRQDQKVLEKAKTALRREQRRVVTTTHVQNGTPVAVTVRYAEAARQIAAGTAEGKLGEYKLQPQCVQGKVYRVCREGEALLITAADGSVPPLDEYEIVALNMETLGRPNPLANFLTGRTVTVGERFALPNEVAEKLMGLGGELGEVTRFELQLMQVTKIDNRTCALFQSNIEAVSHDSSQMRLAVEGPLAIEVDTCRAVDATFAGPIGMSETRGSLSATYQMTGTGKMTVHIATKYGDLAR